MIKNLFSKNRLSWFLGIIFSFGALSVSSKSLVASLFYFAIAILLLPPLTNIPSTLIKKPISGSVKFVLGLIFFLIATNFDPPTTIKETSDSITPTVTPSVLSSTDNTQTISEPVIEANQNEISPSATPAILYEVSKVIDGDTINVFIDGKKETIRLIGIDSPENVDPRELVQCFGKEASNKAKEVLTGKKVSLEADPSQGERDKYDRLLRYVFLEDGTNFNKLMIAEGFAHEYTYNLPYKYRDEFIEAEKKASQEKLGFWADDACPIPSSTNIPTTKPINTSVPTFKPVVSQPTSIPQLIATQAPAYIPNSTSWTCNCSKTCTQISSCEEAYFQLNTCGCSQRDGDDDGVPCESLCN